MYLQITSLEKFHSFKIDKNNSFVLTLNHKTIPSDWYKIGGGYGGHAQRTLDEREIVNK